MIFSSVLRLRFTANFQIGAIEEEVHASRTRTAGKDYLLKAYLNNSNSSNSNAESEEEQQRRRRSKTKTAKNESSTTPECLREMVEALSKVTELNERLEREEEKIGDLSCKIKVRSKSVPPGQESSSSLEATRDEVARLRGLNEEVGREIDLNRRMIEDLGAAFRERSRLVGRLEADVGSVDAEGRRLEEELRRVTTTTFEDPLTELSVCGDDEEEELGLPPLLVPPPEDEDDEELLRDVFGGGAERYRLSNSQLYESHPHYRPMVPPPSSQSQNHQEQQRLLQQQMMSDRQLFEQLQRLGVRAMTSSSSSDVPVGGGALPPDAAARISATGSPGSQSGSSTSGCGTAGSSSNDDGVGAGAGGGHVRSSVNATPDLPPLPPGDYLPPPNHPPGASGPTRKQRQGQKQQKASSRSQQLRQMLKSADPSGDLDSNSDTGLSSLHSSSDEGTYVLDTLV